MYLLEGRGSSREERRSATLNRVALTSLKLAAGAVAAAGCELDWRSAMFDKRFHLYCRERRRSPDPIPVGSLSLVMLAGVY